MMVDDPVLVQLLTSKPKQQIKCIVTAKTHFLAQHLKATTEGKNLVAISEIDLKHFNGNVAI